MEIQQQAGKNFLWLTVAQAAVRILGVGFYLFLARVLSDAGIGQYNFISGFVPFWFIVIDFGGANFLYREWSKKRPEVQDAQTDFNILFTTRFIITAVVFCLFVGVNIFINHEILWPLILFYFSMFLATFLNLYDLYLQSGNQFRFTAIRQIIEKTVTVVLGFALLWYHAALWLVFVAIVASQFVSAFYYYRKVISLKVRFSLNWPRMKELFTKGMPFMFIAIFASVYARIDTVMLRYMKDFATVGWYGAAYKFLDISALFSVLFTTSVFPLFASLSGDPNRRQELDEFFYQGLRIIFSVGIFIALCLVLLAPWLIKWFFPESFSPAILALRILMLGQVLIFLSIYFSNLLIIQNQERKSLVIVIISAALNIGLNFYLIPKFSLYGAAWATVVAECGNLLMLQYFVSWKKHYGVLARMAFLVILNSVCFWGLKVLGQLNSPVYVTSLITLNAVILFALKLLTTKDIKLFLNPLLNKFAPANNL